MFTIYQLVPDFAGPSWVVGLLVLVDHGEIRGLYGLHGDYMEIKGISVAKIIYHMCIQWMLNGYMIGMDQ